jgi:hypothetical protein
VLFRSGEQVLGQTAFTADASSGSVEVVFTFDSTDFEGKTFVVFEYLYYYGTLIAEHTDINDEAQTMTIATTEPEEPEIPDKPGGGAQTGHDGLPIWLIFVSIGAMLGAVAAVVFKLFLRRRDR